MKADPTPPHGHTKHILLVDLCPPQNEEDMTQKMKTTSPQWPKFPIAVAFCMGLRASSIEAFFITPLALQRLTQPPHMAIPNIYY